MNYSLPRSRCWFLNARIAGMTFGGCAIFAGSTGVAHIIVGHPLHMTGEAGEMADEAARFAARLRKELGIEVELVRRAPDQLGGAANDGRKRGSARQPSERRSTMWPPPSCCGNTSNASTARRLSRATPWRRFKARCDDSVYWRLLAIAALGAGAGWLEIATRPSLPAVTALKKFSWIFPMAHRAGDRRNPAARRRNPQPAGLCALSGWHIRRPTASGRISVRPSGEFARSVLENRCRAEFSCIPSWCPKA